MVKIYSWNVNGIRAVHNKGMWESFLENEKPDIVCLQEIKAQINQIAHIPTGDYHTTWYPADRKGYSGTAQLSYLNQWRAYKGFPETILDTYHMHDDEYGNPNDEGRVLTVEYEKFWLVTVYTPNAKGDLSRMPLRHNAWDPAFLAYCKELEKSKPVVLCGDLNVAHTELDLANPKPNRGKAGFTTEERSGFQALIDAGFIDTFRMFHDDNGHYSWWSYYAQSRERNVGWRIDYVLVSESLRDLVVNAKIHSDVLGSDHCPVSITLDI